MTERLRWGILSTAQIGRGQVAPAIQRSEHGTIVAVASRDVKRARQYADELEIERVVDSYEALLADPEVNAVYIPLPNSLHAEWTIRAAEAGKAVLCEKPLATTAGDAERAIDACAQHGVSLMEAFMYRFHPQTRRVQELLAAGAIGSVREVRAHLSVNLMRSPDPTNLRFQRNLGGGALLDMGCYAVSIARMVFGEEPKRIIGWCRSDRRFGVDTSAGGILEFGEGVALVSCSFAADGNGSYIIVGTEGSIEVPRGIIPGLGSRAAEGLVIQVDSDGRRRDEIFPPVDQYQLMVDGFAVAVLGKQLVPLPPEDSLKNMKVLDALARSSEGPGT